MEHNSSYKSSFNLSNKVALVTGASGFLGKEFCKGLASYGSNIALVDLDSKTIDNQAEKLVKEYNVKAKGFVCDVSDSLSVKDCVNRVVKEFSYIDILHNNAAGKVGRAESFFASFENYSIKQWKDVLNVNLDGMFLMAQAVGKQMLKQKKGSIIQTSSIYGIVTPDHRIYEENNQQEDKINSPAVYGVSKAGVISLTKYLATYWADKGIRVNSIAPGGVFNQQDRKFVQNYSSRVPMKRMANVEEIVGAMLFLASDASTYITGQTLVIDGGLTSW